MLESGSALAQSLAQERCGMACFVGAGPLAGAAKESGLKLTELTAGRLLALTETTSPGSLGLASLDAARARAQRDGSALHDAGYDYAEGFLNVYVPEENTRFAERLKKFDVAKLGPRAAIDLRLLETVIKRELFFTQDLAIYERNGDTLRVCYDLSRKARPTEFKTAEGTRLFLVEYKLQKP